MGWRDKMTRPAEAAQNDAMFEAGERKKQKDREDVLRAIYAMQQAGLSPDEMRQVAMGAAGGMNLAGGYGLLDPAIRMAGVNSAYKLGRAGVAQTANDQAWGRTMDAATMAGKPQNIVSYLDLLARSNTGIPLNNPIVENIRPMFPTPAGSYDDQIGDFLGDNPDAFAGGGRYMMDGGPKVLMDADTGMIDATMNENGGEGLSDLPGGGVRVHPGKDKRLGKYRQSKIVKDARRQKPKHMMDGEMMEGMPMAAHGADFQPPAWSYGDQLAGSRAYQDEWADWQAQNPGMALSEMVRTFPGLGNYFKYRFNPYTDSGRTGYRAHNRFTPAGDTAAPGDAGIATGERGGEAPVGGVPRGPGFRDEPYAPTPPRALPVFPRDR